jgi:hypothetical protein
VGHGNVDSAIHEAILCCKNLAYFHSSLGDEDLHILGLDWCRSSFTTISSALLLEQLTVVRY